MDETITDRLVTKLEDLILETERGINSRGLSSADIVEIEKSERSLSSHTHKKPKTKSGLESRLLYICRIYELRSLIRYARRDMGGAEDSLMSAIKFLPKGYDLYSVLAKEWETEGLSNTKYYSSRNKTVKEHLDTIGDQTPSELVKNVITLIIIGIIIIFGMIVTLQQIFPSLNQ